MLSQIEKDLKFESFRKLHSLLHFYKIYFIKHFLVALEVKLCFYNLKKISSQWLVSKYFSDFIDNTCVSLDFRIRRENSVFVNFGVGRRSRFWGVRKGQMLHRHTLTMKPQIWCLSNYCFVIENKQEKITITSIIERGNYWGDWFLCEPQNPQPLLTPRLKICRAFLTPLGV